MKRILHFLTAFLIIVVLSSCKSKTRELDFDYDVIWTNTQTENQTVLITSVAQLDQLELPLEIDVSKYSNAYFKHTKLLVVVITDEENILKVNGITYQSKELKLDVVRTIGKAAAPTSYLLISISDRISNRANILPEIREAIVNTNAAPQYTAKSYTDYDSYDFLWDEDFIYPDNYIINSRADFNRYIKQNNQIIPINAPQYDDEFFFFKTLIIINFKDIFSRGYSVNSIRFDQQVMQMIVNAKNSHPNDSSFSSMWIEINKNENIDTINYVIIPDDSPYW